MHAFILQDKDIFNIAVKGLSSVASCVDYLGFLLVFCGIFCQK